MALLLDFVLVTYLHDCTCVHVYMYVCEERNLGKLYSIMYMYNMLILNI